MTVFRTWDGQTAPRSSAPTSASPGAIATEEHCLSCHLGVMSQPRVAGVRCSSIDGAKCFCACGLAPTRHGRNVSETEGQLSRQWQPTCGTESRSPRERAAYLNCPIPFVSRSGVRCRAHSFHSYHRGHVVRSWAGRMDRGEQRHTGRRRRACASAVAAGRLEDRHHCAQAVAVAGVVVAAAAVAAGYGAGGSTGGFVYGKEEGTGPGVSGERPCWRRTARFCRRETRQRWRKARGGGRLAR